LLCHFSDSAGAAAERPFPFFCDFSGELGNAVREGRHEEFKRFPEFGNAAARAAIPDPQASSIFQSAKLDWNEKEEPTHREMFTWYTKVLAVRRRSIVALIPALRTGGSYR
jgi:1,4-alpha-glucan branching enzyme